MGIINDLREQEKKLLAQREYYKLQINNLTRDIINIRQRVTYMEKTKNQTPKGILYEMFNKRIHELNPEELKEYNRVMQQKRREKK